VTKCHFPGQLAASNKTEKVIKVENIEINNQMLPFLVIGQKVVA
jgi:hypothetical protein